MDKGLSEHSLKKRTFNNKYLFPFLSLLSSDLLAERDYNLSPVTKASFKQIFLGPAEYRLLAGVCAFR